MENKGKIIWGIVIAIILLGVFSIFGKYNSLVTMDESVKTAWAQVENQYQRRFDLIPNIVASVKGEANFEKSTLEAVINARASATKMTVNVADAKEMTEYQKEQAGISQALGRLMVVSENYPNLKSNQAFSDLRVTLEGTENRISTERMRYNEEVQKFNTAIRLFPTNILSSIFGFIKKNLFESETGAVKAPKVEF